MNLRRHSLESQESMLGLSVTQPNTVSWFELEDSVEALANLGDSATNRILRINLGVQAESR